MRDATAAGVIVICLCVGGCAAPRRAGAPPRPGESAAAGTESAGEGGGKVLAEADGLLVTEKMLDERIKLMRPMGQRRFSSPRGKRRLLEAMTETMLLEGEARSRGLDGDPEVRARVEIYERNQAVAKLKETITEGVEVSDEDVRAAYEERKDRYTVPKKVRISQIVLKSGGAAARQKEADALAERARGGEHFAALAKEHSDDRASAAKGGDNGFVTRRKLPKVVYEAVMALEKTGDVAGPIRSGDEVWVVKATDIVPPRVKPIEEVDPWLRKSLLNDRKRRAWQEYVEKVKDEAGLKVYKERIPVKEKPAVKGKAPSPAAPANQ